MEIRSAAAKRSKGKKQLRNTSGLLPKLNGASERIYVKVLSAPTVAKWLVRFRRLNIMNLLSLPSPPCSTTKPLTPSGVKCKWVYLEGDIVEDAATLPPLSRNLGQGETQRKCKYVVINIPSSPGLPFHYSTIPIALNTLLTAAFHPQLSS